MTGRNSTSTRFDVVIIGGGHNGLIAAYYLAKGGRRPLVLERLPRVGGGAVTTEIYPGFKCPTLSHEVLLDADIVRDLRLIKKRGVEFVLVSALSCTPLLDRPPLVLYEDLGRSVESLRAIHPADADSYAVFRTTLTRLSAVVGATFDSPPPDIDAPSAGDLWGLLRAARRFRALGKRNEYRLLRWLTMPVADLLSEWFALDELQATLAGPCVSGTMLGPRSAGSSLVLLLREAALLRAGGQSLRTRGGPGAVTAALAAAAREAGAEIRTGVTVERVLVRDERVVGVVANGEPLPVETVLSALDPKATYLTLIDPVDLAPDFRTKVRNYRAAGTVGKVNLALAALPSFRGVTDSATLAGRVHIGPHLEYLERAFDHAKYGEVSTSPWLDITLPSLVDPKLAPAGAHVASIYVHYTPYAVRGPDAYMAKDVLLDNTIETLEAYAPGIRSLIIAAEVFSPRELESDLGISGGHIFHGELSPDQLFTMRPLLGHARYAGPIKGLYLCGAGTHPGGFMTGTSGRLAARMLLKAERRR